MPQDDVPYLKEAAAYPESFRRNAEVCKARRTDLRRMIKTAANTEAIFNLSGPATVHLSNNDWSRDRLRTDPVLGLCQNLAMPRELNTLVARPMQRH